MKESLLHVRCPECGAAPGASCSIPGTIRQHVARTNAAAGYVAQSASVPFYREHPCDSTHRNRAALVECIWHPGALFNVAEGPYYLVCRPAPYDATFRTTVITGYATLDAARADIGQHCDGRCSLLHTIVEVAEPAKAVTKRGRLS